MIVSLDHKWGKFMSENEEWCEKYLNEVNAHARESVTYFSNRLKPEREREICRALLRALGISFNDSEIIAHAEEPADVIFRSAHFQIREIMEENRRRGDEFKRISRARSIEALKQKYVPPEIMSLPELICILSHALGSKAKKYGAHQCKSLDALVYVNLSGRRLDSTSSLADINDILEQNWRSVSAVFSPYGIVIHASSDAPDFLKSVSGKLLSNCSADDLFS
jgi:hypothetical protein